MSPQRYLSAREVAGILGLSVESAKPHRGRRHALVGDPDIKIGPGGPGTVYGWDPARFTGAQSVADDPRRLGKHPGQLPDGMLIGRKMWAALEGVRPGTVRHWGQETARRRAEGVCGVVDMPAPDMVSGIQPRWRMGTYRTWKTAKTAGAERGEEERGQ